MELVFVLISHVLSCYRFDAISTHIPEDSLIATWPLLDIAYRDARLTLM